MAISQRLIDPSPSQKIKVPISYDWQGSYQAALLETDWTKMQERIQTAESEIHKRRLVLSQDHSGTLEEREALVNAMGGLRVLRMDAASWLERQAGTEACLGFSKLDGMVSERSLDAGLRLVKIDHSSDGFRSIISR